jgi:hypothetical protein
MQVDCAGVSLLMTGSPHTSMPYATHHFKPRPLAGVFLCSGIVAHNRYAIESTVLQIAKQLKGQFIE